MNQRNGMLLLSFSLVTVLSHILPYVLSSDLLSFHFVHNLGCSATHSILQLAFGLAEKMGIRCYKTFPFPNQTRTQKELRTSLTFAFCERNLLKTWASFSLGICFCPFPLLCVLIQFCDTPNAQRLFHSGKFRFN